ncbi:MAG: phosphoribosyl-AMP cyclohydrolase [Hyphomicrobiaceae bacterium]|nr:phosphoribosyl-AMP cyclohydrolase [Hyphomicrobiaceae bacterium]
MSPFPTLADKRELENGGVLAPRFDEHGLITAVVTDAASGEVIMLAHMNAEALARTIETRIATYWSRSRAEIWVKGLTSGNVQRVEELRVDCDQDAVWLKVSVEGHGASCHTGRDGCFYRLVDLGKPAGDAALEFDARAPKFDPASVYGKTP